MGTTTTDDDDNNASKSNRHNHNKTRPSLSSPSNWSLHRPPRDGNFYFWHVQRKKKLHPFFTFRDQFFNDSFVGIYFLLLAVGTNHYLFFVCTHMTTTHLSAREGTLHRKNNMIFDGAPLFFVLKLPNISRSSNRVPSQLFLSLYRSSGVGCMPQTEALTFGQPALKAESFDAIKK